MEDLEENPFLELQKELSSSYKIDKVVKEAPAFKYLEPTEHKVVIPPTADSDQQKEFKFVYISVPETLANIVEALGLLPGDLKQDDLLRDINNGLDRLLKDVKDGLVYKTNPFFVKFPGAYTLMFYSDSIELSNPLGAKKGVYKLVNIYWTIAEIPKHLRSKTENWFLALSVKESDLKLNREAVYKPLVDDLLRLEAGIPVGDDNILRAGLLCHLGDNLESHLVGGFSTCFSSKDVCRLCHIQHSDLPNLSGVPTASAWTKEEYDGIFDGSNVERCGLKDRCVFNVLESFHAVGQLPMDVMHDFCEKVGACDAQAVILSLARIGKISVDRYNDLLANLRFEDYESGDRPLPINQKAEKLAGKALSIGLHIRVMPLLLSRLLEKDFDSDLVDLLFMLSKLNEYILADSFSLADVENFKELVIEYTEKRKICLEQFPAFLKNTPKMHFIEHYWQQLLDFGPFTCTWTARCESRHRDFVNFSESSKNFINILKTLATKNQKKLATRNYRGFFSAPEIQFPGKKFTPKSGGGSLPREFFINGDVLTNKILVKNTKYRVGHLLVTRVESDNVLQVGSILKIVVRQGVIHFLVKRYECARARFRYFDCLPIDIGFVKYSSIWDYKPLIRRSSGECPVFLLHHHLPSRPDIV